ncbi:MAG: hypothetical protein AAB927_04300 [Patescibacteria group bacterium]
MIIAAVIFFLSLLGIAGLFFVKHREEKRQRVIAQDLRLRADERALEFKTWLENSRGELKKLPPELLRLSRIAIHEAALGAAASARFLERQAHRLADMVSHKHHFERREPRSEFLKQMTEHKEGNGLDTTSENGHNS